VYEYVYEYGKKLRECAPLVLLHILVHAHLSFFGNPTALFRFRSQESEGAGSSDPSLI